MRIQEKGIIILSDDSSSDPKQIRFRSEQDAIDTALLIESKTLQESFPVGTTSISLGNISQGRFLYVKPEAACVATIDGQTLSLRAGKASSIWADFTTLSITVTGTPNKIVLVVAGE